MVNLDGKLAGILISPRAGEPMISVPQVLAIAGHGLEGDRYATGNGSFNKGRQGDRQVTLINKRFFRNSHFWTELSRRNLVIDEVELMRLINKEFRIGPALFRGLKYCEPCTRPSTLAGVVTSFREDFFDRGGLIAEILEGGVIKVNDDVVPPPRGY